MKRPINVNVHLFYGVDPHPRSATQALDCLYGYHHAESNDFTLTYSHDAKEGPIRRFWRRGLKAVLGFDFIHAWRNRQDILDADVIWTHTEYEYFAVALLLKLARRDTRPLLLAQSVWLFDRWPKFSAVRKACYRNLLKRTDMLTTHSEVNRALCEAYLGRPARLVYYGIDTNDFPVTTLESWEPHTPIRIAAIGNDRDRDWQTLIAAFDGDERFSVRLATRRRVKYSGKRSNIQIRPVHGTAAQRELYDWADLIVVPLLENKHVSGITVILEGVTCGKPVIATDVGGLDGYFTPEEITYVKPRDPLALKNAALHLVANPAITRTRVARATQRFIASDYTTASFARQHVELTEEMVAAAEGRG